MLTNRIGVIDPGMYLNLEHKTFRRAYKEEMGKYVIDSKTGQFRKRLKIDKNVTTYTDKSYTDKRFSVAHFDMTSYADFGKSKMGILGRVLIDVENNLSEYIEITIQDRQETEVFEVSALEKTGKSEQEYGEILKKRGVVIVDENHSKESRKMVQQLQNELFDYYGIQSTIGELSRESYNIRMIHEAEYYEKNKLEDPHNDSVQGYIVQHMTEES